MAAARVPPDFSGCSEAMQEDWEQIITVTLGAVSFAIAFFDVLLMSRRVFFIHAWKDRYTLLLAAPGMYALLVGLRPYIISKATATATKLMFGDLSACLW